MATIQGVYLALFGRPADPAGLSYFNAATQNGANLTAIGDLAATGEYQDRFEGMSHEAIINSIYQSLFNRDAEPAGRVYFANALATGELNITNIAIAILDGAQGDDLVTVNAKIAAANLFTQSLDLDAEVDAYAGAFAQQVGREFIEAVGKDDAATQNEADTAIQRLLDGEAGQNPGGGNGGGVSNKAPVSNADVYVVDENGTLSGNVLANDVDPDGHPLRAVLVEDVSNGTLTFNEDGTFTYTPDAGFEGTETFTYRAFDSIEAGKETTVTITVEDGTGTVYEYESDGSYEIIEFWNVNDLIRVNTFDNTTPFQYAELGGVYGSEEAALNAAEIAHAGTTDVAVAFYYQNGTSGPMNAIVAIDGDSNGSVTDLVVRIVGVTADDISHANFELYSGVYY